MIERELRYLVHRRAVPELPAGDDIAQGYLVADGEIAIRVRRRRAAVHIVDELAADVIDRDVDAGDRTQTDTQWTMTIKAPLQAEESGSVGAPTSGSERREVEISLNADQAGELWEICGDRTIEKTRHVIALSDGLVAEVDVFSGRWDGLVMVEVEFGDRSQVTSFVPPDWFGPEVTSDRRFTNAGLAMATSDEEADLRQIIQAECGIGA